MNKYIRGGLIAAGIALASLYSPGCKSRDEPIVVHPRVTCCHGTCASHSHDLNGNYTAKPSHELEPKYGNRTRPELSRHNPFEDSDARERAERLIERRRPHLSGHNPFEETGRPRVQYGAGASGSTSGISGSASQRSTGELMPNPYTGCNAGSAGSSANTDPCYDTSRTVEERARACAERLPTADEAFGPGADESLEQRLRDCEELNRQLEQQLTDSMNPDDDHGRG